MATTAELFEVGAGGAGASRRLPRVEGAAGGPGAGSGGGGGEAGRLPEGMRRLLPAAAGARPPRASSCSERGEGDGASRPG